MTTMTDPPVRPSDTLLFEVSEQERGIIDLIPEMPGPPRWPAFNAIRHLNRAWKIREVDPEMSFFRCLTAEEEAATALFHSLKRRAYPGADKLNPRDHLQKNAVIPFWDGVTRVLAKSKKHHPEMQLVLDTNQKPGKLFFRFLVPHPFGGQPLWAMPEPPLHFSISKMRPGEERLETFYDGVEEMLEHVNADSIIEFLRNRSNRRNKVLYASAEGYSVFAGDIEATIRDTKRNVFTILKMYLMIDPYSQHQNFVQQALTSFLQVLNVIPAELEFY